MPPPPPIGSETDSLASPILDIKAKEGTIAPVADPEEQNQDVKQQTPARTCQQQQKVAGPACACCSCPWY